jgi:hypothetical protein
MSDQLNQILKAKAFPIGTVREYNGYKYVKQADGWKPLKQTKTTENKEPKVETSETPGPLAAEQTLPKTEQQTTSATMDLDNKVLTKDQPPKTKVMTGLRTGKKSAIPYQSPPGSKVNLVGITAFGKSKADVQKELNAHLYDCEVVLQNLNISFKQPLDFTCERIAEPKQIQADFQRLNNRYQSNNRIGITDRSSGISKSLIHEIGHAVDYSLKAEDSRGSFFEDLSKDPFHKSKPLYDELKAILEASPIYKQRSDKGYLADPGEIFARSFEVYAYSRTRQLHKDGRVGGNFINAFNPDLLRATHTDRDSSREDREEVISRVHNIMEKLLFQNPIVKSLSLLESLNNQLLKSKAKEIGAVSSSGEYKKVAEGKWEKIKDEGKPQPKEDSAPTAKELTVEEHKKQAAFHDEEALRHAKALEQMDDLVRAKKRSDPSYKITEEAQAKYKEAETALKFHAQQAKRHNAESQQSWKDSSKKPASLQQKLKQRIFKGGDPKPDGTSTYNSTANIKRKENRVSGEEAGTSTNNAAHRWTTSGSQTSDAARKKEEKEQKKQSKKTLREWKMVDGELIEVTSGHGRGPDKQPRKKRALTKALIGENDNSGVAINTTDYALEAERSGDWLELFQGYLNGFKIGDVPVEISLNDRFSVLIGQVDDGLYSAYVKQLKDVEGNDAPENVSRINSQPLPAIIQYLKAKEFIRELAKPVEPATIEPESGLVPVVPTVVDTSELSAALSCYKDNDAIRLVEALNRLLGR